jgi:DnaB helicase-like protein/AAA domain-containing protein
MNFGSPTRRSVASLNSERTLSPPCTEIARGRRMTCDSRPPGLLDRSHRLAPVAHTHALERPLPHNREAERSILGAILLDNNALNAAVEKLRSEDYFLSQHRQIFECMIQLAAKQVPIDTVTVMEHLEGFGQLEAAGGVAYLSQLADGLPRGTNVEHYARIVKEKAVLRSMADAADALRDACLTPGEPIEPALARIREFLSGPVIEAGQKRIAFKTAADLASGGDQETHWIVCGVVAVGAISGLDAKVKAGKTTLVLDMVSNTLDGTPFLGLPTAKTPVVYLTEQPLVSFRPAIERARLLGREDFVFLTFAETRGLAWPQVASEAAKECARVGASLLVVDTLSQFAGLTGDRENNAGDALEAMLPLQHAATQGIAILVTRHERKSGGDVGDSGRGSSAFAGVVDIVLSLRRPEGKSPKNRRLLQSLSRFSETPAELLVELAETGYLSLGGRQETAFKEAKDAIFAIAPKLEPDAADIMELARGTGIARPTAQRAIDALVRDGLLVRVGKGKRGSPYRYFLAEIPFCSTPNVGVEKNEKILGGAN